MRSKTEIVLPSRLSAHTLSSAEMAMPKPGQSTPPPRYPNVIGEIDLPFGAILETPPPKPWKLVDCPPTRQLSAVHKLPSASKAMPPGALNPPPAKTNERVHALGSKLK